MNKFYFRGMIALKAKNVLNLAEEKSHIAGELCSRIPTVSRGPSFSATKGN